MIVIKLSSSAVAVKAAYNIVDIVIEHQMDTHVSDFYQSACILILLAGLKRTAKKDVNIGFHQTSISPADAKLEYKELKSGLGVAIPYDYAFQQLRILKILY